jgi:glycosyltransferase involved in cell wall biosynthesis
MTVDPELPVPPANYGGIERIVDMLVRGLFARGHQVTLFAHPDSTVPCHHAPYPALRSQASADLVRNTVHVSRHLLTGGFDLVHSHARLAYLLPVLPSQLPKIMTYGRHISPRSLRWGERLARGSLHFTAVSRFLFASAPPGRNRHVIYNAAPASTYHFRPSVVPDAPLVFLGRIEAIKGAHLAIEVAHRCARRLILAGNVPPGAQHEAFFREMIAPSLGPSVEYVGPVNDCEKDALLGAAAALLMPVLWDEPFGMVMVEAFACGTPVIALDRGAIPEVVDDGTTGFVCPSIDAMVLAVDRLDSIDRRVCRQTMERRFSDTVMVDAYEQLYRLLATASFPERA